MKTVILGAIAFGLIVVGALDVQKTAIYIQRVVVTVLGGTPTQSTQTPFQPEYYEQTQPIDSGVQQ